MKAKIFAFFMAMGALFLTSAQPPAEFSLIGEVSEDLNPEQNAGLYKLKLQWEPIDEEKFDYISLEIEDEAFDLLASATNFETFVEQPIANYKVKLTAHRKGFGLAKKEILQVETPADNNYLSQQIKDIKLSESELLFSHWVEGINPDTVFYEVQPLFTGTSVIVEPVQVKEKNWEIAFPLDRWTEASSLKVTFHGSCENGNLFGNLRTDAAPLAVGAENFFLTVDANQFSLVNAAVESYHLQTVRYFGESLHLGVEEVEAPAEYELKNSCGETVAAGKYGTENNGGIPLALLEPGQHYIFLDGKPLQTDQAFSQTWHTVARNGASREAGISQADGLVVLQVAQVKELPPEVYDLIVDPGHGGMDTGTSGNGMLESHEVLEISKYMAERFEDHGLKVKLTRDGDYEPAGPGNFHHVESPYYENGRVEQVYRHQAKYLISNHLNAIGGGIMIEGYEIYTSILTDDAWSSTVSQKLADTGRLAKDSLKNEHRQSLGSYKKLSNEGKDYLYMLRETGGELSSAANLTKYNPDAYDEMPLYGAEAMLIEYAYIDNPDEAALWQKNYKKWGEAAVKGTLEYLGIDYKEK